MKDDFSDLVSKYPSLIAATRQRDVVFRYRYEGSSSKMPFMITRYADDLHSTYKKLNVGHIDQEEVLDEITSLMEQYYGMPYPLSG